MSEIDIIGTISDLLFGSAFRAFISGLLMVGSFYLLAWRWYR